MDKNAAPSPLYFISFNSFIKIRQLSVKMITCSGSLFCCCRSVLIKVIIIIIIIITAEREKYRQP